MTGIERLRELARRRGTLVVPPVHGMYGAGYVAATEDMSERLSDIADQIEGEQEAMVADSPYDALPPEDRDAIAWVRERGGLDHVRAEWRSRVPYDRYVRRRQSLLSHIAECETALGRRREIISSLGHRISDLTNENAELRRRAMPEGMSWPRFEDDAPVAFRDKGLDVRGHARSVEGVKFTQGGFVFISDDMGNTWWANDRGPMEDPEIDPDKRVKRHDFHNSKKVNARLSSHSPAPAPKVLDADGAEIRVGDTVWTTRDLDKFTVTNANNGEFLSVSCKGEDGEEYCCYPTDLTHRAPVLAADGKPLREGETVWDTKGNGPYIIDAIEGDGVVRIKGNDLDYFGADFTHERPKTDSWERIEADCMQDAKDYCDEHGIRPEYPKHSGKAKCEDLVRRAKALAGGA